MFKKIRVLVSAQHANMLAYRAEIYLWVLAHTVPFIMMSVWMTAAGTGSGANFSMDAVGYARYFLAVYIVRQFTAVWMIYEFEWHVNEGRLSPMLLRPINAALCALCVRASGGAVGTVSLFHCDDWRFLSAVPQGLGLARAHFPPAGDHRDLYGICPAICHAVLRGDGVLLVRARQQPRPAFNAPLHVFLRPGDSAVGRCRASAQRNCFTSRRSRTRSTFRPASLPANVDVE